MISGLLREDAGGADAETCSSFLKLKMHKETPGAAKGVRVLFSRETSLVAGVGAEQLFERAEHDL